MRLTWGWLVLCLVLVVVGGCAQFTKEGRVEKRAEEKGVEWRVANPAAIVTPEIQAQWRTDAEKEVAQEIAAERVAAKEKLAEAVGHAKTGNYVAGGVALLMAGLLAIGVVKTKPKQELAKVASAKPPGGGV